MSEYHIVSCFKQSVADLGFHEGGFGRSGALAHREKFCKPRPLPAKNHALLRSRTIPQVLSYRCLRFILAACSLEVVYTGKIAITVDRKKKHDR